MVWVNCIDVTSEVPPDGRTGTGGGFRGRYIRQRRPTSTNRPSGLWVNGS